MVFICILQNGNTIEDAMSVFMYKKEMLTAVVGEAYILKNLIFNGKLYF